jgi:ATP-binding cassette subfamily F protein uup
MDKLVDHLFVFEGDGLIKDFPGNYTQYRLEEKADESWKMTEDRKIAANIVNAQPSTANRKLSYKEKREFEQLEKEIANLEAEKQSIEEQLSNPDAPFEKLNLLSHRINTISSELHQKEMRWLELSEYA